MERAVRLGVSVASAAVFAAGTGDLHRLEQMISAGCLPDLACDILT